MQDLHTFSWTSPENDEDEGQVLNLRLNKRNDGSYMIQNLGNPDQVCEAATSQETTDQFRNLIERS